MPTGIGSNASATPNHVLEATVAIVAAHLGTTTASALHVPGIVRQVYEALSELLDQDSRDRGALTQGPGDAAATEESRSDCLRADAELRRIAEEDSIFPWPGPPGLRGSRAGTRIGESPRERFRSRNR